MQYDTELHVDQPGLTLSSLKIHVLPLCLFQLILARFDKKGIIIIIEAESLAVWINSLTTSSLSAMSRQSIILISLLLNQM